MGNNTIDNAAKDNSSEKISKNENSTISILNQVKSLLAPLGLGTVGSTTADEEVKVAFEELPAGILGALRTAIESHVNHVTRHVGAFSSLFGSVPKVEQIEKLRGVVAHLDAEIDLATKQFEVLKQSQSNKSDLTASIAELRVNHKKTVASYPPIPATLAEWQQLIVDTMVNIPDVCQSKKQLRAASSNLANYMAEVEKRRKAEIKDLEATSQLISKAATEVVGKIEAEKQKELSAKQKALEETEAKAKQFEAIAEEQGEALANTQFELDEKEKALEAELKKLEEKEQELTKEKETNKQLNNDIERLTETLSQVSHQTGAEALGDLRPARLKVQLAGFYGSRTMDVVGQLVEALVFPLPGDLGLKKDAQSAIVTHMYDRSTAANNEKKRTPAQQYRGHVLEALKAILDNKKPLHEVVDELKSRIRPSADENATSKNIADLLNEMAKGLQAEGVAEPFVQGAVEKPRLQPTDRYYWDGTKARTQLIYQYMQANKTLCGDDDGYLKALHATYKQEATTASKNIAAAKAAARQVNKVG